MQNMINAQVIFWYQRVFKMKSIQTIVYYAIYGSMCYQLTRVSSEDREFTSSTYWHV